MGQVIADVAKDAPTKHCYRGIPIVEEYCMRELVEGCCKGDEEGWRHDEAISVHRKVVMYAVEEEVGRDADSVVWQIPRARSVWMPHMEWPEYALIHMEQSPV